MKTPANTISPDRLYDGLESLTWSPKKVLSSGVSMANRRWDKLAKCWSYDPARVWKLLSRLTERIYTDPGGKGGRPSSRRDTKEIDFNQHDEDEADPDLNKIPRDVRSDLLLRYEVAPTNVLRNFGSSPTADRRKSKEIFYVGKAISPDRFFAKRLAIIR